MTQWSTSFRVQGRTRNGVDRKQGKGRDKRAALGPMLDHALRSLDELNGVHRKHSNPQIDPARISDNVVRISDGAGGFREAVAGDQVADVMQAIEDRVALARHTRTTKDGKTVPVAVREDASLALEVVLQLDPEYTGRVVDMTDEQKADAREKLDAMVEVLQKKAGAENVVAIAEHWDEENVHYHVFLVPLEDEKLVGSKIIGRSKQEYSAMHDQMRTALRVVGYDATFDRVDAGRGHEDVKTYKARRDREKKAAGQFREASSAEARVDQKLLDLQEQQAALLEAQRELDEDRERAERKAARVDKQERQLGDSWGELNTERQSVQRRESAVAAREREVHAQGQELAARTLEGYSDGYSAGLEQGKHLGRELWADVNYPQRKAATARLTQSRVLMEEASELHELCEQRLQALEKAAEHPKVKALVDGHQPIGFRIQQLASQVRSAGPEDPYAPPGGQ